MALFVCSRSSVVAATQQGVLSNGCLALFPFCIDRPPALISIRRYGCAPSHVRSSVDNRKHTYLPRTRICSHILSNLIITILQHVSSILTSEGQRHQQEARRLGYPQQGSPTDTENMGLQRPDARAGH
jgi:hypothetical protein